MNIQKNISLKKYNTFGIDVLAKKYVSINSSDELMKIVHQEKDIFLLSGGSNMLLTRDIEKLVVHLNSKGVVVEEIGTEKVLITVEAGENWHDFVLWCIKNNYGGLENLSLIPGNVGTSPIQNIGAYGVEIENVFAHLTALEITTGRFKKFTKKECQFGYRNSIFKNALKGKYIICSVSFELITKNHKLNTSYGALQQHLSGISTPTIKDVSDAVIAIRKSKLPDPNEIGNSGSFFKNPIVGQSHFQKLLLEYPEMPYYNISSNEVKVPAGWLIEKSGFKGKRFGDAGVHTRQALVLVNHGNATGMEIYQLAETIKNKVTQLFQINLEIEVNIFH